MRTIIIFYVLVLFFSCGKVKDDSRYEGTWERVRRTSLSDSQMIRITKEGDHFRVKHFRPDAADTIGIPDSAWFNEQGLLLLKNGGNILYLPESKHIVVYGIEHQRKR